MGWEKRRVGKVVSMAMSMPADRVPDMGKRYLMNLLLLGVIGLPTTGMLILSAPLFASPSSGESGGGIVAKDTLSSDVLACIVPYFHRKGSSGRKKILLLPCDRERGGGETEFNGVR